ncbi:MAG TPA: hypothetical protein VIY08_14530, partial [Candidatus Nitrosocosmicus sp.]
CKASVKLSAQWYKPYRTLMIRGTLACGDSGLSGKSIVLTSTKVPYAGNFATVVTGPDGSFNTNYKTTKPLTTVSAWYLGKPDQGGIASKVINLQPCPWCSTQLQSINTVNTQQTSSNSGNAPNENSNTQNAVKENSSAVNTPQENEVKKTCSLTVNVSPDTLKARSYDVTGKLTCGDSKVSGATISFTTLYYGKINGLSNAMTKSDGTYSKTTKAWTNSVLPGSVVARYAGDNEHMSANSKIFKIGLPNSQE